MFILAKGQLINTSLIECVLKPAITTGLNITFTSGKTTSIPCSSEEERNDLLIGLTSMLEAKLLK